ncbi:DNA polymerase-3 subunit gamma/tau [Friedmanniella endophytica]|uniref:DNA-directed DNA polymerase n=1 Tax=Microlunatus kandeliicorticis TaxID=1759536 RepID=A0A7W3IRI9_9ACTN|nr:DNA polymerase III subunit gamma and tau [Microlunatus kandeliicorticis]MBA8793927.1 DNA polymerase-3 subunit gamma/tau [Microlunatus kandeliicorticis]
MEDVPFDEALIEAPPSPAGPPLALYRRYRPDTFAQVIGQEHVTEPLQRALVNNRVNHAYLFSGPRGCGKTTSARILARALNCERAPRAEPCGECQSCRDLATGGPGSIDVIEIDAASHGGVDDARDLRERAFFAPVSSRYKIYIVDEAHMVTTAGFNALLKLVEEPPPHVKFIFATTEPDKVIGTIRSRTHHYPFRLVPPRVLGGYLTEVCGREGIAVENGVIPLVVRAGAGSVRDSLSVLDQLLGGADEQGVSYAHAAALLGYTPDSLLDEMMDAFAAGDAHGVFAGVDKVIEVGQDPRRFAEDLLRRLRDLVIVAAVPDALTSGLVDVADDQADRLSSQAAALGAGELTRAAEVIAAGLTEMRGTTAPRLHLELMCARVLLPGSDVDDRGIHARLDRLERRIGMGAEQASTPTPPARKPAEPVEAPRVEPAEPVEAPPAEPAEPARKPAEPVEARAAAPAEPVEAPRAETAPPRAEPTSPRAETAPPRTETAPSSAEPAPPRAEPTPPRAEPVEAPPAAQAQPAPIQPAPTQPARPTLGVTDVRRLWPEVLEEVKGRRRFTWILLSQNAQVAEIRDGTLVLSMPSAGVRENFARGGSEDVLREALVVVLGADLRIETMVDPAAGGSRPERGSGPAAAPAERAGAPTARTDPSGAPPPEPSVEPPSDDWPEPVRPPDASSHPPSDASSDPSPHADSHAAPAESSAGPPSGPGPDVSVWGAREPAPSAPASAPPAAPSPGSPGSAPDAAAPAPSAGPGSRSAPGGQPAAHGREGADAPGRHQSPGSAASAPRAGRRPVPPAPTPRADEPDEGTDRSDEDLDDVGESGAELLVRHLGAEIIAEEEVPR